MRTIQDIGRACAHVRQTAQRAATTNKREHVDVVRLRQTRRMHRIAVMRQQLIVDDIPWYAHR